MQFDVFENGESSSTYAPFLVDIQPDLLSRMATRLVVPLVFEALFGPRVRRLHPVLSLLGKDVVLATQLLAAVDRRRLRVSSASLAGYRDEIIAAVDVLLAGV